MVLLASCGLSQEEKTNIAAVTCSIMSETRNMDAAIRVREMNDAREKIGGEPFLRGDSAIQEAFEYGLCQELVLNESYDETLQPLKDAKREKERIADSKPSVKEEFHPNGKLESRANHHPKNDGGEKHGLWEEYYASGQVRVTGNYKDGKQHGAYEGYYDEGELQFKGFFNDGEKDRVWETYYKNGQLEKKESFKNGKLDGPYETYHDNGQLRTKGSKLNGKNDGTYEAYLEDGKLDGYWEY